MKTKEKCSLTEFCEKNDSIDDECVTYRAYQQGREDALSEKKYLITSDGRIKSLDKDVEEAYQKGRVDAIEEFVNKFKLVKLTYPHNNAPSKESERALLQTIEEQMIKIAEYLAEQMNSQKTSDKNKR